MLYGLFRTIGVNKMLDKEGADFDKLLENCREKQKKPLKIPYKKMAAFDIETRNIDGTACHVVRVKNSAPEKAVLYLFGGGYILPPDPGDIVLCGQIAGNCDAEVWFPLYPMAPDHRLAETLQSTLKVYQAMLEKFDAENIRFFGTSSGAGQALSLCVYIRHENAGVPLPGRLVLQSPGLQAPPSESQKAEMERRRKADVMIPPRFFDAIAPVLATGEEAYLLSPLLYDLTGFPETDVFYGTREVMIAYLKDFQDACKKYGVKLHTHIGKGMMHCWGAMEFVPEAKAVRQEYFSALGRKPQPERMKRIFSEPGRQAESDAPQMQKLTGLSETEVTEIARQIADTFYDYEYNEEDVGLIKFIPRREDMFTYMNAIVKAAYKSGVLYTTSDRHEGFLMLSGEGAGSIGFVDGIRMILAEKKALGGLGKMKEFISACFCEGGSIETRMRKANRKFLRIEMLAVRPEYQKQGYMRKMMEYTYQLAEGRGVPVILDTDDRDKASRYEHLGMKLDRIRTGGQKFHMYDLIREI